MSDKRINNKFAVGNSGKPPIFETPEALEEKCSEYFHKSIEDKEKITITGLALYLGFCSRQSIYDYEKLKEFSYIIKRAKLTVENSYEVSATTFDMFALKNMGWKDKTETDITTKGESINKTPEIRVNTEEEKKQIDAWLNKL